MSNQPSWLNFSNSTFSSTSTEVSTTWPLSVSTICWKQGEVLGVYIDVQAHRICFHSLQEETVGTRVLMPIPGGLVELLVPKQVMFLMLYATCF